MIEWNHFIQEIKKIFKRKKKKTKRKRALLKASGKRNKFSLRGRSRHQNKKKTRKFKKTEKHVEKKIKRKKIPTRTKNKSQKKPLRQAPKKKQAPAPKKVSSAQRKTHKPKKSKKIKKSFKRKSSNRPFPKTKEVKEKFQGVLIGEVTHYFSRIRVVVIKIKKGIIRKGDRIHIKGRRTDFVQPVDSLQIESLDVKQAKKGQLVGLKVPQEARVGDLVFKVP